MIGKDVIELLIDVLWEKVEEVNRLEDCYKGTAYEYGEFHDGYRGGIIHSIEKIKLLFE